MAAACDRACIAGAVKRRATIVGRKGGEFGDRIGAGIVDGHARGRCVRRAAGNAAIGQIGTAGAELKLIEIESKSIGCDLGERSPRALPHIVRADLHDAAAVAAQHRPGLRRKT